MNRKGKLTIMTFAFAFLAFAILFYAFYVIPNTGTLTSTGGTGTFWGRYGYSPSAANNLSTISGYQSSKDSNVTNVLEQVQCSLTNIGKSGNASSSSSSACPEGTSDWSNLTNFIRYMVLGAYQSLIALFSIFGGFKVLMSELALLIGISPDMLNVIIGAITLSVFISWIIFIFNRSFEQ